MERNWLVMALASVFAALAAVAALVAVAYEPFVLVLVALFGAVAALMWYHASGRLAQRVYRTVEHQARKNNGRSERGRGGPNSEWARRVGWGRRKRRRRNRRRERTERTRGAVGSGSSLTTAQAYDILDVDPGVDDPAIKQAYREKVKDVHPDTEHGSEEAFKRVNEAYEQLHGTATTDG